MPCFHPIRAYRARGGGVTMKPREAAGLPLDLPCNGCVGCRMDSRREKTTRILHEAQTAETACFLTLTYDNEHLPEDWSLRKEHTQRFWKRVRKYVRREDDNRQSALPKSERDYRRLRYFCCGEYGDQGERPHYHAAVFNVDFREDWRVWSQSRQGHTYYTSATWTKLWGMGHVLLGELEADSAQYVAGYVMKKQNGMRGRWSRLFMLPDGLVVERAPEFSTVSRNPGLGSDWFDKYESELANTGRVFAGDRMVKAPLYYLRKLKESDPEAYEKRRQERLQKAAQNPEDRTADRRHERERVATARGELGRRAL